MMYAFITQLLSFNLKILNTTRHITYKLKISGSLELFDFKNHKTKVSNENSNPHHIKKKIVNTIDSYSYVNF